VAKIHGCQMEKYVRKGRWGKVIKFKGIDLLFLAPRREVLSLVGANVVT
jgi:hypothetical protein